VIAIALAFDGSWPAADFGCDFLTPVQRAEFTAKTSPGERRGMKELRVVEAEEAV
jgi:hypothetical protein